MTGRMAGIRNGVAEILVKPSLIRLLIVAGLFFYAVLTAFIVLTDRPIDYYTYVIAAYAFMHGQGASLQSEGTYTIIAAKLGIPTFNRYAYPPLTSLVVWPLTILPLQIGAGVWVLSCGVASLGAAVLLSRRADAAWKRSVIILASIGFAPTIGTMSTGQVSAFVLLLTALGISSWRTRESWTGILLGAGICLKPLSIALVWLLAWRARWRALASATLLSAIVGLAGVAAFGSAATIGQLEFLTSIFGSTLRLSDPNPETTENLLGLVTRWLSSNRYGTSLINEPQLALPIYFALALVFGVAVLYLLWPFGRSRKAVELDAALLLVTTLLLSPITELNHMEIAFVAFPALLACSSLRSHALYQRLGLTIAYFLIEVHALFLKYRVFQTVLLLDLATWGMLILWLLLSIEIHSQTKRIVNVNPPSVV